MRITRLGMLIATAFAVLLLGACGGDDGDDGGGSDDSAEAAQRWEGRFDSTFGELTFRADGAKGTGTYEFCGGTLEGEAEGSELTGDWTEDAQACTPGQTRDPSAPSDGSFDFTIAANDESFTGNWRYSNGDKDPRGDVWQGTRVSDTP
jgi:hypothetical protein